jgi:trimethylamine:corrinoid methyltransferase-like protein
MYRQMALGSTVSLPLPIGVLDNASAFSPVQAMIDLEMNRAIYEFARGIEISEQTINMDLLQKIGFGEKYNYLSSDQTLQYFRDILWNTDLLDTTYRKNEYYKTEEMDREILAKADSRWKELVSSCKEIDIAPEFKNKVQKVIDKAKRDLLS